MNYYYKLLTQCVIICADKSFYYVKALKVKARYCRKTNRRNELDFSEV